MSYITVFYAGLVLKEFDSDLAFKTYRITCNQEVYNGAYYYAAVKAEPRRWWRMDGTPVLDADVPLNLKTWVLLL